MMMKKIVHLLILILFIIPGYRLLAQQSVQFSYDASGNRVSRVIILDTKEYPTGPVTDSTLVRQGEPAKVDQGSFPAVINGKEITIFPNPNKGMFTIEIAGFSGEVKGSYLLTTLNGNHIAGEDFIHEKTPVDISNQPDGTYILTVSIDQSMEVWKIIKK